MTLPELIIPNQQRVIYKVLDAGIRPSYINSMAIIGMQEQRAWQGNPKPPAVDLVISYEIIDEVLETEDGDPVENQEGEAFPKTLNQRMKFVGGDMSKLTKLLKSVDPTGEKTKNHINATGIIGSLCQVDVIKKDKPNSPGELTNYVGSVSGKPNIPGWEPSPIRSELVFFDFYNPDYESFLKLPKWVQNVCKKALDFPGSALEALLAENEVKEETEGEVAHRI